MRTTSNAEQQQTDSAITRSVRALVVSTPASVSFRPKIRASLIKERKLNAPVKWKVKGLYTEACNCESVCPCYSHEPPSYDYCQGPCIWHVEQGRYGDVELDGLTVVMIQHCPGHMRDNKWKCWFYIEDRATDEQLAALTEIFTAKGGGYIGKVYASLWEVVSVERAKMDVKIEGWQRRVSILGMMELVIGNLRLSAGPALCFIPNVPGVAALADVDRFDNGQIAFSHPNQSALSTTFAYRSD
jgi:hypothetical protein